MITKFSPQYKLTEKKHLDIIFDLSEMDQIPKDLISKAFDTIMKEKELLLVINQIVFRFKHRAELVAYERTPEMSVFNHVKIVELTDEPDKFDIKLNLTKHDIYKMKLDMILESMRKKRTNTF